MSLKYVEEFPECYQKQYIHIKGKANENLLEYQQTRGSIILQDFFSMELSHFNTL